MLAIFGIAIFIAAALLFLIQPLIGKALLPLLGGSPAVWNACMVFFQAALLLGYLYSHIVAKRLPLKLQALLHSALLIVAVLLPLQVELGAPDSAAQPGLANLYEQHPTLWLIYILTISVGIPFFVVSTSGPLLQHWFSRTDHPQAKDPYFLYAASNAGSAVGLLSYPLVLEPRLSLGEQSRFFTLGFVVLMIAFAAGMAAAIRRHRREAEPSPALAKSESSPALPPRPVTWRRRGMWVLYAFVPSSLMIGATQHLTTDIAAIPMLWVIPLFLYLSTFMLAFSSRINLTSSGVGLALLPVAILVMLSMVTYIAQPMSLVVALHLGVVFLGGLMCHRRLAEARPGADHLTDFYLMLSVGGVLGGMLNSLIAPVVFDRLIEYPLVIAIALLVRPLKPAAAPDGSPDPQTRPGVQTTDLALMAVSAAVAVGGMFAVEHQVGLRGDLPRAAMATLRALPVLIVLAPLAIWMLRGSRPAGAAVVAVIGVGMIGSLFVGRSGKVLYTERTFFGVHQVVARPAGAGSDPAASTPGTTQVAWHALAHGSTTHGLQLQHPELGKLPTAYFFTSGPLGDVFRQAWDHQKSTHGKVGIDTAVLGLGCGTIAAYNRAPDSMIFFEIDPAVIHIATTEAYFTYFSRGEGRRGIVQGDGRLTIAAQPDSSFDLIIMDAFTSDAVPVHLITRDAFSKVYLPKLRNGGLIAVNVSNRHVRLWPVLGSIAKSLGITGRYRFDGINTDQERAFAKKESAWVVLARTEDDLGALGRDKSRWLPLPEHRDGRPWTDEYSNILSAFNWE